MSVSSFFFYIEGNNRAKASGLQLVQVAVAFCSVRKNAVHLIFSRRVESVDTHNNEFHIEPPIKEPEREIIPPRQKCYSSEP